MSAKKFIQDCGVTLTVSVVAEIAGYKSDVSLHQKYKQGKLDELKEIALDAQKRFDSIKIKR